MLAPIQNCFSDRDPRVLLAACEAIFNFFRIYRYTLLQNRFFDAIFESIIMLISNPNQEVRDFAKKVDVTI